MLVWSSVAAVCVVLFLSWTLYRRLASSRIDAIMDRRRPASRLVSSGEFVDGSRHLQVALALTKSDLFYENADMQASLDLRWVREVEYDTRLASGHEIAAGRVLRLRCHSQLFEFVLPEDVLTRWHVTLPPRRDNQPPAGSESALRLARAT